MEKKNINKIDIEEKKQLMQELKRRIKSITPLDYSNPEKVDTYFNYNITLAFLYADIPDYYDEAIYTFIDLLGIAQKLKDDIKVASIQGSIASICYAKKDFTNAAQYYRDSLDILEDKQGYLQEKMIGKKGLGLCLMALGEDEKGINLLLEAAKLSADITDINTYMEIISILKMYYREKNDWELIIELEKKALQILKDMNVLDEVAYSYIEIGIALSKLKRYEEALSNFKNAVNYALDDGNSNIIYSGIILVAETYFHQRKIEEAKIEYLKALRLISFIGNEEELEKTTLILKTLGTNEDKIEEAKNLGIKDRKIAESNEKRIKT